MKSLEFYPLIEFHKFSVSGDAVVGRSSCGFWESAFGNDGGEEDRGRIHQQRQQAPQSSHHQTVRLITRPYAICSRYGAVYVLALNSRTRSH